MKLFFLLFIPIILNEPSDFLDVYFLHNELKSEIENITYCKKMYIENDTVYRYELFVYNEYNLLVNESQYSFNYFLSDCYYNLENYSYSDSCIFHLSALNVNKYEISEKITNLKFYEDSLVCYNRIIKTVITEENDTTYLKEYRYKKNGQIYPYATFTYFDSKLYSIYNEIEDEFEYLFHYKGDTLFINFVLPLHPLGNNTFVNHKSLERDSTVIVIDEVMNLKKIFNVNWGEMLLEEVTILNSKGLDSISYFGRSMNENNYMNEYTSYLIFEYGYRK